MGVNWPDEVDSVLAGDLTAALAYATPAGGAVATAVSPIGLRDRTEGTVTFTTSLGFGRKLDRIKADPKLALAYHAREHGFDHSSLYVLVQGTARPVPDADPDYNENVLGPASERFMGAPRRGFFWDRVLREYYADRVPVADPASTETVPAPAPGGFRGAPRRGFFWARVLREYSPARAPVTIGVERIVVGPPLDCPGERVVHGSPQPGPPPPQDPPKK